MMLMSIFGHLIQTWSVHTAGRGSVEDRSVNIAITLMMNMLHDVIKCETYSFNFNLKLIDFVLYFCIIHIINVNGE